MTNCNKHLPLEIWMVVFSHIDSAADLAQCRLVCQYWNNDAEKAMFNHLCVIGNAKISKLCKQLVKKPQIAQLIKSLEVGRTYGDPYQCIIDLLELSFTSNMQYLSARLDTLTTAFYSDFLRIVKIFPSSNYQMKMIPRPSPLDDPYYADVAYEFREALEHIDTSMTCDAMETLFDKLKVFKRLKTLTLSADPFESIGKLESVLKNCVFLRHLRIQIFSPRHVVQDHKVLSNWTAQSVKKVESLTEIAIDIPYPDVVQYLAYKYPNLQRLTCYNDFYRGIDTIHMLIAVRNLSYFKADFYFNDLQDVLFVLSNICHLDEKRTTVIPTISFEPVRRSLANQARLNVIIDNKTDRTVRLVICLGDFLSNDAETGKIFLDHLGTCSNYCSLVDLTMRQQFNGSVPLNYILGTLPTLKMLEFQTSEIRYKPYALENKLEELFITYLKIDNRVLPQLSKLSPNLEKLTLHSYSTLRGCERYRENSFEINIPNSSLSLLILSTYAKFLFDYDDIIPFGTAKERLFQECFVKVSILDADVQMFLKLDGSSPPVFQSQEDFGLGSQKVGSAVISVTCANIVQMRIDFGHIEADVNIQDFVLQELQTRAEVSKQNYIDYLAKAKRLKSKSSA